MRPVILLLAALVIAGCQQSGSGSSSAPPKKEPAAPPPPVTAATEGEEWTPEQLTMYLQRKRLRFSWYESAIKPGPAVMLEFMEPSAAPGQSSTPEKGDKAFAKDPNDRVLIARAKDADAAKQAAGKDGWAWGRFVVTGDAKRVAEVRAAIE